MNDNKRLFDLFDLYYTGTASASETDELMQLMKDLPDETLSHLLKQTWKEENLERSFFAAGVRDKMLKKLQPSEQPDTKVYSMRHHRNRFLKVAAAAVILLVGSATAFLLLRKNEDHEVARGQNKNAIVNDIKPGGDKAILTLANGQQIILDTAANGAITNQGGTKVIKIGGQIVYNGTNSPVTNNAPVYNTITTPKGGQYQLVLADGSKAWLNAASSLRFPTTFNGDDRKVELTGEGYFEVAHDAAKPFKVHVNTLSGDEGMDVKVLGTHFNINSYSDEPAFKTTLLEGKVLVTKGEKYINLNPGQQAILRHDQNDIRIDYDADVNEAVAWKNGNFVFNKADVETIMRQIVRWYDVEIMYGGKVSKETFSGIVSRQGNVSQVLRIMEESGMKFKIEGKKIIVL